jgi:hypothetical protein
MEQLVNQGSLDVVHPDWERWESLRGAQFNVSVFVLVPFSFPVAAKKVHNGELYVPVPQP